jgi:soluble lytic murein transglycosylase-like protein
MSPELVKAVIKVESNYNRRAVSPKGAQGLMQLMPATAKRFGVKDSFDPEQNITGGIKYLRFLLNEFGEHNLDLVLAGYNAGEQAVRKYGNKVPPYRETRKYVKKVKSLYLGRSMYKSTQVKSIYRYVDKNGIIAFTNIPRVN